MRKIIVFLLILLQICLIGDKAFSFEMQDNSWLLFGSADCEGCEWFIGELYPEIVAETQQVFPEVVFIDLEIPGGYEFLLTAEAILKVAGGEEMPALIIGSRIFYGQGQIQNARDEGFLKPGATGEKLAAALIQKVQGLDNAGGSFLSKKVTAGFAAAATELSPEDISSSTSSVKESAFIDSYKEADILYFESPGCRQCARVELQLSHALRNNQGVTVFRVSTGLGAVDNRIAAARLQTAVAMQLNVPESDRALTPMVVSGELALYGAKITDEALSELLNSIPETPFWRIWDEGAVLTEADEQLTRLGSRFSLAAIMLAGLADGVNPCAFAVVLFLMSCLALGGGMGRRITALYGLLFCAGVFMCYLLLGVGFLQLLSLIAVAADISRWLIMLAAGACLVFAFLAFLDAGRAWKHGAKAMSFGTPPALTRLAHKLIRGGIGGSLTAGGIFLLGMAVSGIELICTGQIYLPVLVYLNSQGFNVYSFLLLIIYNLAFIIPLLVVVALATWGSGSVKLSGWARKHAAGMRLIGGIILLLLALLLFMSIR